MGYTYDIDAKAMFEDRFEEFVTLGIPRAEVTEMRDALTEIWADAPGGWSYEWSRLALKHAEAGQMLLRRSSTAALSFHALPMSPGASLCRSR